MPSKQARSVDPESRKKLDQLVSHIKSFTGDDDAEHFEVGQAVGTINASDLLKACGYSSLNQLIKNELVGQSKSQLMLYASVARAFSKDTTTRIGVTKLSKLLSLGNALNVEISDPPDKFAVPVPDKKYEGLEMKPFTECTVVELRRAINKARGVGDSTIPPELAERVKKAQAAIDAALGEDSPVNIKARMKDGRGMLDITSVPEDDFDEVVEALEGI